MRVEQWRPMKQQLELQAEMLQKLRVANSIMRNKLKAKETPAMKVLSIMPPWAGAIIWAGKDVENRDWPTNYRGRIAIHASKKLLAAEQEHCQKTIERVFGRKLFGEAEYDWWINKVCARGAILGTVELIDCVKDSTSPWFTGPYGFVLKDPVPLVEPIPILGKLSFWEAPQEIENLIFDDMRKVRK